ncbi:uncharacterized protein TRIVIDRAFT_212123 [Trichoderma virens Gv29-8]|uniref:Uncharacterized protein n=1 Tax=Hypocrea virens (strain Gv29-8 / FGSC 10586) TaxID=413071 RepID=G9MLG8_HYPVG|nr:uncharacterized protein TRIVIDRAFT_212123 [Trichoderma virens Gv29-8]EHK24219.1 hypothetical protein TRIVIDRAFT_212123 [Trichoderma virens Gv29-8]
MGYFRGVWSDGVRTGLVSNALMAMKPSVLVYSSRMANPIPSVLTSLCLANVEGWIIGFALTFIQ